MNIIANIINSIFPKSNSQPKKDKIETYTIEMEKILNHINDLDYACNEAMLWDVPYMDKYQIYVCLNALEGLRTAALRDVQYIENRHANMMENGEFRIKTHKRNLKSIHADYQKVAIKGPVFNMPIKED